MCMCVCVCGLYVIEFIGSVFCLFFFLLLFCFFSGFEFH